MTAPGYPNSVLFASECPSLEVLDQFVRLELPGEPRQAVRAHVEQCPQCQSRLDQISSQGDLSPSLKPTVDAVRDATVQRLVKGLCREFHLEPAPLNRPGSPIRFEPSEDGESLGWLNQYLVRRELASGATGTVFEALDTQTSLPVAIKFIRSSDPQMLRRVEREARATSQVQHDSVVSIQSVETATDGRLFLVMPLVAGKSLSQLIQEQGVLPLPEAVSLVRQIAGGLAEVHRQGLLHRDIKPANIVVDAAGSARLTDFGLASFVDEESSLTESGVAVGTPAYMSPEQARNTAPPDARCDVYSLGATLYECLTGTRPFRGQPHDILRQIQEREPVRPRLINENIPRPLEAICLKAMSKSPAARYATAGSLDEDLERWQQGKRVTARLPGVWRKTLNWARKDPRLSLSLAAIAGTLITGVAVSWFYWSRSVDQARLAESRFDASLQTINTLADLTTQSLSGDPGLASIRQQVQVMADKAFEPLVDQRPSTPASLVRYLKAMDNLGTIKHAVAGPAEALAFRQKIIDENRASLAAARDDDELRRQWAALNHRLAVCQIEVRDFPEATAALDEAAAWLSEGDPGDLLLVARVRHSRGTIHKWVNDDNASAAPEFRKAVELAGQYAEAFPDDRLATATVNNSKGWLADCEMQLGNLDLAETLLREVHADYAALAASPEGTFANRLETGRAAFALVNLLVGRGDFAAALQFGSQAEQAINLLQASNPSLMEPAALKIGFSCHLVSAGLLAGRIAEGLEKMQQVLHEAAALEAKFPGTTRTWQAHGHARQMWFIASLNAAEYPVLLPFLEDWIGRVDQEIATDQNTGFNQQLRLLLLANQAIAFDWSGDPAGAQEVWTRVLADAPDGLRPAFHVLSQLEPARQALRDGQPLDLEIGDDLETSLQQLGGFLAAGTLYPSTHHTLAEAHALAAYVLRQEIAPGEGLAARIAQFRENGLRSLQIAHAAGFHAFGDRLEQLRADPLFEAWHDTIHSW